MRGMRAVARDLQQALLERRAGVARTPGIGDLLALAGRAVDDGDGLGVRRSGAARGRGLRAGAPGPGFASARRARAVIAARALRGTPSGRRRPSLRVETGRDHRDRLAAERIVDRERPDRAAPGTAPSAPATRCGTRIGSLKRRRFLFLVFCPSGALSSSSATAAALANHRGQRRSRIVNSSFTVTFQLRRSQKQRGGLWAAPRRSVMPGATVVAARLAFGGKAELVVTPRIRSSAA